MMTMIQIINKLLLLLSLRASLPSLFLLEPPCPSSRLLLHVLVVVGAAKVGNPPNHHNKNYKTNNVKNTDKTRQTPIREAFQFL